MTPTILAILPNWLGDLVMVEPAVRALRSQARVVGVATPQLAEFVDDSGIVDSVEVFDRRARHRGPLGVWRAGRELRKHRADGALVFGPSLRAAALAAFSGARLRRGFGGEAREIFLHEPMRPPSRETHLVDAWLELVGVSGGDAPQWFIGPRGELGLEHLRAEGMQPSSDFAVVAPSATYGPAKQWSVASFAMLCKRLQSELGLNVVLIGGPSEAERRRGAELARETGAVDLTSATDLPTLAAVLREASVFIGNDSGPMHLAAALGCATVGIFGSTSPAWTAPRGRHAAVVGPAGVDCTPCFQRECRFDRECLVRISVDEVLGTVVTLRGKVARS